LLYRQFSPLLAAAAIPIPTTIPFKVPSNNPTNPINPANTNTPAPITGSVWTAAENNPFSDSANIKAITWSATYLPPEAKMEKYGKMAYSKDDDVTWIIVTGADNTFIYQLVKCSNYIE
jgi:hypothetical protein